jgi:hypothetical protein
MAADTTNAILTINTSFFKRSLFWIWPSEQHKHYLHYIQISEYKSLQKW